MKKHLAWVTFLLFVSNSLLSCGQSDHVEERGESSTEVQDSLAKWLPIGLHKADLMDSLVHPARHTELLERFMGSAAKHPDWFIEVTAAAGRGEFLKYHPNTGLTSGEWDELQSMMDSVQAVPSGTEEITIRDSAGYFRFEGTGRLAIINVFTLDPGSLLVHLPTVDLPFADAVTVVDARNAFKSEWNGYSWRYEYPPDADAELLKDLPNLTIILYQFTVGRIHRTGKRLISIKVKEIRDGVQTANLEVPIVF